MIHHFMSCLFLDTTDWLKTFKFSIFGLLNVFHKGLAYLVNIERIYLVCIMEICTNRAWEIVFFIILFFNLCSFLSKTNICFFWCWTTSSIVRDKLPVSTSSSSSVLLLLPKMHTSATELFPTCFKGELL